MSENENENNAVFSETVDNTLPEGNDYDVFSENTAKNRIETEQINRDYLKHIYKEDMSFLNKDVRMTRMQYLSDVDRIHSHFKKEQKTYKKNFIFIGIVLLIFLSVGIWAIHEWYVLWQTYKTLYSAVGYGKVSATAEELKGFLMMTTFYGTIGVISAFFGIAQFCFFGHGYHKKIKHLNKEKHKVLETLESRKKEAMLLGQYDSVK